MTPVCTAEGVAGADRAAVAGQTTVADPQARFAAGRSPVLDQLREMAAAPEAERARLREAFVGDQCKLFRLLAHRLCRTMGLPAALHRDEVEQLVALEALAWVDELMAAPAAIEGIENFEGLLHVRSRVSVRAWADRHLSPASNMVTLNRRVRMLNQLREELRGETGREPIDRDLPASGPEECLLHPAEGPALVRTVIERARSIGGVTADVAEAWLCRVHDPEGAPRLLSPREVAERLDLPQESAAAQVRKVRTLAQRVLAEELGVLNA